MQNTARTFATGLLEKRSLLDNPLIWWSKEDNLQCLSKEIALAQISDVLAYNLINNPIVKKYMTVAEQTHKENALCILSADAVARIVTSHSETEPFQLMQEAESQCEMGVLENTYSISRRKACTTKDTHEFGSINLRGDISGLIAQVSSSAPQVSGITSCPVETPRSSTSQWKQPSSPSCFHLGTKTTKEKCDSVRLHQDENWDSVLYFHLGKAILIDYVPTQESNHDRQLYKEHDPQTRHRLVQKKAQEFNSPRCNKEHIKVQPSFNTTRDSIVASKELKRPDCNG